MRGKPVPDSEWQPARNEPDAERRFTTSMNKALGHLTNRAHWQAVRPDRGGKFWTLALVPDDTVPLACKTDIGLNFHGTLSFQFEQDQRDRHEGGVKVAIRKYVYSLRIGRDKAGEFAAWHWHPDDTDRPEPHFHLPTLKHDSLAKLEDWHVPTARVLFEDVLLFAVRDLGARTRDDDRVALTELRDLAGKWVSWR